MASIRRIIRSGAWAVGVLILIAVGFLLGYVVSPTSQTEAANAAMADMQPAAGPQLWYCSMHPQIIRDKPGKCPICEMDLIPMPADMAAHATPRELVVSEAAARLMDIQTSAVERRAVTNRVRTVGKVDYDETRVKSITAWLPGRIDRLYVDFTGTSVRAGDHLVDLYSPELFGAQAELLQAAKAASRDAAEASEYLKDSAQTTLAAAREKLRLLGLKTGQIETIETSGQPVTHVTIYSPIGGVVVQKMVTEGMYVSTGTHIYTVADLSHVWVKLDAYESDLPWIRYGQEVTFTAEAYPGEVFRGWISFIAPTLDPKTRTMKVRVNVRNPDGRLKPEMFVRAVVESHLAQEGKVMDADLAGKWTCPMHPSVVKDEAGTCDVCGMDLVTTESLGYVTAQSAGVLPLVVPASAPLITGQRAIVYVKKPDTEHPTFEGRQIILGPRAGDFYIVKEGLTEGEQVVTNGNFKIDSALQIQAKPSMMNPEGDAMPGGHQHRMEAGQENQTHSH
ncbi:MAG TPA: efflux RND transporter periplasmic adaptor subunit [Sedimentisphaerales bacterium]|nr:efflux RND transporter periplasmic adaptor subunit [Sedimentisphaerales bacterium]HRS11542.1 efflux RND transporter periplasmic adaptor subunit [Sedimentisphaerales bacterium]HRV48206.1 efflux RND transporter periplasmic adaptor subunit [Sedimentisphaerales bacterium]